MLISAFALQSCTAFAPQSGSHELFPAARYVKLHGVDTRYAEYLVDGVIPARESLGDLPAASGPLKVDCQTFDEIGMMVRPANWNGGGYHHMYSFSVAGENSNTRPLSYFSYRRMMAGGYVRGAIRFKDKPDDGIVTVAVAHRGEELLSTEFEFVNCY